MARPAPRNHCRPSMTSRAHDDIKNGELRLSCADQDSFFLPSVARPRGSPARARAAAGRRPSRHLPHARPRRPRSASSARSTGLRAREFQQPGQTPAAASRPVRVLRTRMIPRPSSIAIALCIIAFPNFNLMRASRQNKRAPERAGSRGIDTSPAAPAYIVA